MTTTEKQPLLTLADWAPGPRQGKWTYSDYAALDDGQRYEIVNGVLIMTPAPGWPHQEVVGRLFRYLSSYLESAGLGGAFVAPLDVELAPNLMFQPDVVVLLKRSREKLSNKHIVGAPDLVVEVTSLSTAIYDRLNKYEAYAGAGIPEYWIANPETCSVEVSVLESGVYSSIGVFREQDTLPSGVLPDLPVCVEQFFTSVWREAAGDTNDTIK